MAPVTSTGVRAATSGNSVNVDPGSWTTSDFIPRVAPLDLDDCRLFAFVSDRMHGSRRAVDRQAVRITAFIREAQVHLARERPTWALRIDVQDIVVKPRRAREGNTVDTPPVIGFEVALFFDVCGLKEGASSFLRIWAKWC